MCINWIIKFNKKVFLPWSQAQGLENNDIGCSMKSFTFLFIDSHCHWLHILL